ncbi:hypothetical protein GGI01_000866 [Coemansia sp. RSA 376]|nr:hypothetical protein H4S03_002486 [Coemansia sp. S3946]KAJ2047805.1 hypothetical protein H4S04_004225 [Coemansia sp. S16]KAJ2114667.1 hypothetical protein IW146_002919 [Coemansia sp. RSA 922]KAJ2263307.1 hypothetical protein GGI01_000866 [Coemansia sp. RSA 376]
MVLDVFELSCFVASRLDGRALEARVAMAAQAASGQRALIYVHPYPPLGGQFRNNIVHELSARFDSSVGVSVAFNLRGAGASEGRTSWTGTSEQEDLRSILDMLHHQLLRLHPARHSAADVRSILIQMQARGFLHDDVDIDRLDGIPLPSITSTLLCGYSYGSVISSGIAADEYPGLGVDYAHISFPYSVVWALALQKRGWYLQRIASTVSSAALAFAAGPECTGRHIPRTLFIAGTADTFTGMSAYDRWWAQLRSKALEALNVARPELAGSVGEYAVDRALATVRVHNADHGWMRRESEVSDAIEAWWWHEPPPGEGAIDFDAEWAVVPRRYN